MDTDPNKEVGKKQKSPIAPTPKARNLTGHETLERGISTPTGIETLLQSDEGYIVGRINNELLRYKTDAHFLTVSPTGGGKTTGTIIPNLLDHPGSAFVIDIRGETVAKTATAKRLQGHRIVVLDPYQLTEKQWGEDSYNPFDRLYPENPKDRMVDSRIKRLVAALMFDPQGRMSNEPIWDNATKNLLTGLISLCVKYWPSHRHNLLEILDIVNLSSQEMEMFAVELMSLIQNDSLAENDRVLKGLLKILTEAKATTKITDNAVVQAQTLLSWVGDTAFEGMLENSSFSFEEMQKDKMTVYLVVPEEHIDNCAIWTRLMLESAIFSLKDVYKSKGISTSELHQEDRILFLLDELPAFGQLDIISKGMATLRGRGVNLWLFLQNIAQLEKIYGKEDARTIIGNAAMLQAFKSNELEELEYFSRLIGDEYFDVQTVSIGETQTEGSSISRGKSNTISNSESVSKTTGTADSFTEATNINWSKSKGRSRNRSRSTNKSYGFSKGRSNSQGWGDNSGKGTSFQDGKSTTNKNRGSSTNKSRGNQTNESWNKGTGTTEGVGTSFTKTEGGGETKSKTKTTNESTSQTTQSGHSDSVSENQTDSQSKALSRNISVKQERMKIETVRTLREKMSGRNQLLQIRGAQPFFSPRMSYFVKFTDVDCYMFPDLAVLASLDTLDLLLNRQHLNAPPKEQSAIDKAQSVIVELQNAILKAKEALATDNSDTYQVSSRSNVALFDYYGILSNSLPIYLEDLKSFKQQLFNQKREFNEIAIAVLALISVMKDLGIGDFFSQAKENLTGHMQKIEVLTSEKSLITTEVLKKWKNLPLMDNFKGKDLPPTYSFRLSHNKYYLETKDVAWVVSLYTPLFEKILKQIKSDRNQLILHVQSYEGARVWLKDALSAIKSKLGYAVSAAIERETKNRHDFFMEKNGLL